jgi:hypothetical protein
MKETTKDDMAQIINVNKEPSSEGQIAKFQINSSFRQIFLNNKGHIRQSI